MKGQLATIYNYALNVFVELWISTLKFIDHLIEVATVGALR